MLKHNLMESENTLETTIFDRNTIYFKLFNDMNIYV